MAFAVPFYNRFSVKRKAENAGFFVESSEGWMILALRFLPAYQIIKDKGTADQHDPYS